jgi:hypothetical protein
MPIVGYRYGICSERRLCDPTAAHRTAEVESTKTMIDRVEAQFDSKHDRFVSNTAYATPVLNVGSVNFCHQYSLKHCYIEPAAISQTYYLRRSHGKPYNPG